MEELHERGLGPEEVEQTRLELEVTELEANKGV